MITKQILYYITEQTIFKVMKIQINEQRNIKLDKTIYY